MKMLGVPALSPCSLGTNWLLYPASYPSPGYPGTEVSSCEVQTTDDLSEALLPSGLNVSQVSTRASPLLSPHSQLLYFPVFDAK